MIPNSASHELLKHMGLGEKEVVVYLALLSTGTDTATTVSKQTQLSRSTAHFTCQQLVRKGLVRATRRGKLFLFSPEPPEKLLYLIEHKRNDLKEQEQQLHRIIGELKALVNPHTVLPRVHFYEGKDGIADAYRRVLEEVQRGEEICFFTNAQELQQENLDVREFIDTFARQRAKKGVHARVIAISSPVSRSLQKEDNSALRETRIVHNVPHDDWPVEIVIYHDKLCAFAAEKNTLFAYIVQNAAMVNLQRAMFELSWRAAE